MATEQSMLAVIRAARPTFGSLQDKAAYAIHAAFLSAGYILNATGPEAFTDDALSSCPTDEVGMDNWTAVEDNYAFIYSYPQKGSKKVLVKCLAMNDKLLVDVLKEGDSKPLHFEINVGDYVKEDGGTNYSSQFKNLQKLATDINKQVLNKLDCTTTAHSSSEPESSGESLRVDRGARPDTGVADPDRPYFSPSTSGFVVPPVPGSDFSDLFPGSGAGMYPNRGDFGGGSMLVGPQDPRFFGGIRDPGLPGVQPGVPPGARFDPYGPPGVPGFEPGQFARNPRRPRGGPHPDVHHFHDGADFI